MSGRHSTCGSRPRSFVASCCSHNRHPESGGRIANTHSQYSNNLAAHPSPFGASGQKIRREYVLAEAFFWAARRRLAAPKKKCGGGTLFMPWTFVFRAGGTAPPHPRFGEGGRKTISRRTCSGRGPGSQSQSVTTTLLAGSTWPTLTLYSGLLFQVCGGYLCIFQCIFQCIFFFLLEGRRTSGWSSAPFTFYLSSCWRRS